MNNEFIQVVYYADPESFRKLYEQGFLKDLLIEKGYVEDWVMYLFYEPFSAN